MELTELLNLLNNNSNINELMIQNSIFFKGLKEILYVDL